MYVPEPQRLTAAEQLETGIHDATLLAGGNVLGAEIDNRDSRLTHLALALDWAVASAAAAGGLIQGYLVHALDGNDEDGGASLDPHTIPVAIFRDNAGTAPQRQAEIGIPIGPFRFKVLLVSTLDVNATVRLAAYRYALQR